MMTITATIGRAPGRLSSFCLNVYPPTGGPTDLKTTAIPTINIP